MTTQDEQVVAFLADQDARCPVCDYGLRGVPSPVCPECACPLSLEIASRNQTLGPWLFAIVAYAIGLGFNGVTAALLAATFISSPPSGFNAEYFFLIGFGLAAAIFAGLVFLTIKRRVRWLRAPRPAQWRRAGTIFAVVVGAHVGFGVYIIFIF